ncbi:hypothetical protein [Kibdelosporangium philippinense]|uniref:hypothetical protein n=1 Tax=Kibdelosporangium philippinense TaxID=211113 RepID=UPI0036231BDB
MRATSPSFRNHKEIVTSAAASMTPRRWSACGQRTIVDSAPPMHLRDDLCTRSPHGGFMTGKRLDWHRPP